MSKKLSHSTCLSTWTYFINYWETFKTIFTFFLKLSSIWTDCFKVDLIYCLGLTEKVEHELFKMLFFFLAFCILVELNLHKLNV